MTTFPPPEPSPKAQLAADTFTAMAKLVTDNVCNGFGGTFAIIPPGEGDAQTILLLDNSQDPAIFWSLLQTRAQMALAELESSQQQGPFGRR